MSDFCRECKLFGSVYCDHAEQNPAAGSMACEGFVRQFKIGDRVTYNDEIGTVVKLDSASDPIVQWDDSDIACVYFSSSIELYCGSDSCSPSKKRNPAFCPHRNTKTVPCGIGPGAQDIQVCEDCGEEV